MNTLRKLAPHAAILIGNMYYVFWGIDRVNKSMNFIDNEYTKFLLVLLIALCAVVHWPLLKAALRRSRRGASPAALATQLGLMGLNALLGLVLAILLLIDLFAPDMMLFLKEFVKFLILLDCVLAQFHAALLIARDRAIARNQIRRAAASARSGAASAGRSAGYPSSARSGYGASSRSASSARSGYGTSSARDGFGTSSRSASSARSSYGTSARSASSARSGYGTSSARNSYGTSARSASSGRSSYGTSARSASSGKNSYGTSSARSSYASTRRER